MELFSERYGYLKPSEIIIREKITIEIQNAICSCFDRLEGDLRSTTVGSLFTYIDLEKHIWTYFFNQRESKFYDRSSYQIVVTPYIEAKSVEWFRKLDLVEFAIKYLYDLSKNNNDRFLTIYNAFVNRLNNEFERFNFAYRIINNEIVEVSSKEEIRAIEDALQSKQNNIKLHLNRALELYAKRPSGDYRNSIKESISAVEAYCREKTGENTLGKALKKLENNGIIIPKLLEAAFDKLYAYTNHPDTGIRHALMDDEGTYTPSADEALFMLVSCCSFINYLNKKVE